MNLEPLLDWAGRCLAVLERPVVVAQHCTAERLEAKLGWLRRFQPSLEQWREWWMLTDTCVDELRRWGLTCEAPQRVRRRLAGLAHSPSGERLRDECFHHPRRDLIA